MKRLFATLLPVFFMLLGIQAQLYYLDENWEDPSSYSLWTQAPTIVNKEWKASYGGQFIKDLLPFSPEIPYQGAFNMGLFFQSLELDTVKLISPFLELGGAVEPTLRFYHCQYTSIRGPDFLKLYFRQGPNSPWDLIDSWETDISEWVMKIFDIKDQGTKYLTDTFQLAFEGIIGNGYGVYIDSVTVTEDDVVPMFVKKTSYNSMEYSAIPSGATDIPLEEVVIRVLGNDGEAVLDTLTFMPTGDGINYLDPNSFKLFWAKDGIYTPFKADTSIQIGTATLTDGKVKFSNLNRNLRLGDNYLYLTASFNNSLAGETNLQFKVPAHGISINDTLFPASAQTFNENHLIKETVFYDNFESGDLGWTLEDNFEIGWPDGNLVGSQKNPESPFNGTSILATDLNGSYHNGIDSATMYFAYTPELDLTYYIQPEVYYHNQTVISGSDKGVVDYSIDGGVNWQNFWMSTGANNNAFWFEIHNKTLSNIAKRQAQFQLRFGIIDSESVPWPGFGIDNFAIIAEKLHTDVGVTNILSPYDDCIDCGNDTVKAWFRNYADGVAPDTIPVYFGLWGVDSVLVQDTIFGGIAKDDSVLFTFSQRASFPKGDFYDRFTVGVNLSGDQDAENDTLSIPLMIQNNITPAHQEDFEYKGGVWFTQDSASWLALDATGTVDPNDPLTPTIWLLSPTGAYLGNDSSWVTSGCYDLSDSSRNIVQFKYWAETEFEKDGSRIEFSIDDGLTWSILDDPLYGASWGWMPDTVEALKSRGWTGSHSSSWTETRALLPSDLDTVSKAKFRLLFMSNPTVAFSQGFAFDDFEIFPAPTDIGASDILSPVDACQGTNPTTVTVRVKNFGYNRMLANDTVIIGVEYKKSTEPTYSTPFIDTLILGADLLPGNTVDLVVNSDIDISDSVTYDIRAYTLIEDDPWYYLANNDTFDYSFDVWPSPVIELVDTIGSYQPDTVVIKPQYGNWKPGYTYSWTPGSITDSIYDVAANGYGDGIYKITATEPTHSCSTTDSVNVLLLYSDAGVDSVLSPHTSCELSDSEIIQIRVRNMGTDSIKTNSKIVVGYQVDGDVSVYRDTITLTGPLNAGHTFLHSFNNHPYDFSVTIDYTIRSWGYVMSSDSISSNDTTTKVLTVYGYSPLDLGADTIVKGLSLTLDAGPAFVSYMWNDDTNDTLQTKFLDASAVDYTLDTVSGEYSVYVEDANGCIGRDTINVWFKIRDVLADTLTAPLTSCERAGSDNIIKLRIRNTGSDTILTTDIINYSYAVNGGGAVIENIVPSSNINPGGLYEHSFATTYDFSAYTTYSVALSATTTGDLHTSNDNIVNSITTNPNPVVDFGVIPDPIFQQEYILDAGSGSYTYLWQDAATTTQTYTATSSGNYGVVVTNPVTGCVGGDTADLTFVIVDFAMFGIEDIDDDNRICPQVEDAVIVTVFNLGNQVLTNATLNVGYRIGAETPVYEEITVSGAWGAGASKVLEFTTPVSFTTPGINELKAFINEASDINPANDAIVDTVTVFEPPIVDFGGDTLQVGIPHVLDAGEHQTYEWNDGWDGQEYTVTSATSQLYWVRVSDENNSCLTTKSVWIEPTLSSRSVSSENLDLNLYPNPASEFLNIVAEDLTGKELFVEIYSITNQLIWADHHDGYGAYNHKLDISSFNEGVYLLRVRNSKINHVQRFIVH